MKIKWKEMSVFHKVVFVFTCLFFLAGIVISVCDITGVLPKFHGRLLVYSFRIVICLGITILFWKKQRVIAIINLLYILRTVSDICFWFEIFKN